jgi:hypothetical protein
MTTIKRAFEIAASGECTTLEELKKRLKQDGHFSVEEHLAGSSIRKQLNALIADARRSHSQDDSVSA